MKFSKNKNNRFLVILIISILTISVFWSVMNGHAMLSPPNNDEIIKNAVNIINNQVIILNDSTIINNGDELRIINSTVYFNSNDSYHFQLIIDGILYVENSNLTVADPNFDFVLNGRSGSDITIKDSKVENAAITSSNADWEISRNTFFNFTEFTFSNIDEVILTDNTFESESSGVLFSIVETSTITGNTFTNSSFGIRLSNSRTTTIEDNDFLNIETNGIYLYNAIQISNVLLNDFVNTGTSIYSQNSEVLVSENEFDQGSKGIFLDNADSSTITYNNFTETLLICIEAEDTKDTAVVNNLFKNSVKGLLLLDSPLTITENTFDNVTDAISSSESDAIKIYLNEFINIPNKAVEVTDCWDAEINYNNFTNVRIGITLKNGNGALIDGNMLISVDEGLGITNSRQIQILGNTVENTITGYYLEQIKDSVISANGAINATYGFSLWSAVDLILASNGVFDSVYGMSVWFSQRVKMLGNELNTSLIGIIARSSSSLTIKDGDYRILDIGVQVIGCLNPKIIGNTFDDIANEAIVLVDSSDFIASENNFLTVGDFARIEGCLGDFNRSNDGNYYEGLPPTPPIYIDDVTILSVIYTIYDYQPLDSPYQVQPSIEFVIRNIIEPSDLDEVKITTQIFVPAGSDVDVYLQYELNNLGTWNNIDITSTEDPIGSIGAINQYTGIIPAYPYDYTVVYRIMTEFVVDSTTVQITTTNETYVILTSPETPIIIYRPEVRTITLTEDNIETTIATNEFYEDYDYLVYVRIVNRTEFQLLDGRPHVNLTYTEKIPITNETFEIETFSLIMDYNKTTGYFHLALNKKYSEGTIIEYFICAVDINGTYFRTVLNYSLTIIAPPGRTGFDTITLLSIGGTLLVIQAIVVLRRRKRKQEE
ncbi:MAG: right-handed parallel beta-helix repeat-containing protein [Candidatus Thorarchaeota archaeon]